MVRSRHNRLNPTVLSKVLLVAIMDILATAVAFFLGLWLRFDFVFSDIYNYFIEGFLSNIGIWCAVTVAVLAAFNLYNCIWVFVGTSEVFRIIGAYLVLAVIGVAIFHFDGMLMPRMSMIVGYLFSFVCSVGIRFAYRLWRTALRKISHATHASGLKNVMLIGAGDAGRALALEFTNSDFVRDHLACVIDDNPVKINKHLCGAPIVGNRYDIPNAVKRYKISKIILAIPSATAAQRRDILNICKETECELKNLPGMYQFVDGTVRADAMKPVEVEDLLGRESVQVDLGEISDFLSGKVVLVTGGGGSIGSELCRQIAAFCPKQLIVFDIYENNAHAIQLELQDKHPELDLQVLIGSVRDSRRIQQVFEKYTPDIVYHAAAHKHVPLMENSPCETIKNNAIGTYKTAYAAMLHGCQRFVLISTDKAVNPINIMGASKRLCEMIVQSFDRKIKAGKAHELTPLHVHTEDSEGSMPPRSPAAHVSTEFVAVRFGNVLGSNGSVIPRFKEQIAAGGPVTVTHPDIIRYFMTIPEAASLVLQAGTYAKGGEIYVLDMGTPVKIDTLARNLIRLSGLTPDVDIPIVYTGLRPGEKLFEEKLMDEEGLKTTPNQLIHIGQPIPFDTEAFLHQLQQLMDDAYHGRDEQVLQTVALLVPTYRPAGAHGSEEKGETYEKQLRAVQEKELTTV